MYRALLAALLLPACYAHGTAHTVGAEPPRRPTMLVAQSGIYTITRDGKPIGEERFTITSSGAVWRAEGKIRLDAPAQSIHGYEIEIHRRLKAPLHFVVYFELFGEKRRAEGWLMEDGFFEVTADGIGGKMKRRIPYAPGTMLAFDSPIFASVFLARTELSDLRPVRVRTIDLPLPSLDPSVLSTVYERVGEKDGLAHVTAKRQRTNQVVALWVRPDGLTVRSRKVLGKSIVEHRYSAR